MYTLFDPVLLSTAYIRINLIYVIQYFKMVFQTKLNKSCTIKTRKNKEEDHKWYM